ncbi:DUF1564 family protein [Leptospira alstonii]|uniref:PF07600 family protein n=2 Tax=Leptospira alstonii TaxID=28452 RepID=T0FXB0_9LEPT|nr:PF07600 family protein [Leptospira alstonii serovar Sichuan str. 79601]EQA79261.1 PF07600 family protein [Leptospira alstonii serovar Pingchang str. 80-412]EQA82245.1 PF07600 family protein [Leptospira alstonii serovar Pingchang str. 80-412]
MEDAKNQNQSQHVRRLMKAPGAKQPRKGLNSRFKRITPSDLWIPRQQVSNLTKRIAKFGCLKSTLHFLLKKNRNRLHSLFAHSKNEKTLYQKTELELVRFSFRPDSADWAELRIAARYYGVSICNFFVMLLLFDENESNEERRISWENFNDREFRNSEILLTQLISSKRNTIFFSILIDSSVSQAFPKMSSA